MRISRSAIRAIVFFAGAFLATAAPPVAGSTPAGCPVVLLVGADHRGELAPCNCPGLEAGSLGLRAAFLRSARLGDRFAVVADAGDFTPLPSDSEDVSSAETVVRALEMISYDAVAVGEAELLRGPEFLAEASQRLPLVCANVKLAGDLGAHIPGVRVLERDGCRVAVTAYVDPLLYYEWPQALARPADSLLVTDASEALRPILAKARADGLLLVVLAHADQASVAALFGDLPCPDVIVVGHDPQETRSATRWKEAIWVEPGARSRGIAQLTFRASPAGPPVVDAFRIHELKQESRWDERVEELVRAGSSR
jgi:2',3'-cyclic-nucleotide 2'-phosphodiesterase (5'-nucleotidase family)